MDLSSRAKLFRGLQLILGAYYYREDYGVVQLDYPCDTAIAAKTHYLRALHPSIKEDYVRELLSRFRGQDNPETMLFIQELCMMADCLYYGLFGCHDIRRATALYRYCDEAGFARASHNLGLIKLKQRKYQEALAAFEKAAVTRADSCLNLALLHKFLCNEHEKNVGDARDSHAPMPEDDPEMFAFPYKIALPDYWSNLKSHAERGDANCGRYLENQLYRAAFRSDNGSEFTKGFENLKSRAYAGDPIAMRSYAWEGFQGSESFWMKDRDFIKKCGPTDRGHLHYWLRSAALTNDAKACIQYVSLRSKNLLESGFDFPAGDLDLLRKAAGYGAHEAQQLLGIAMMSGKLGLSLQDEGCFWWQLGHRQDSGLIRPDEKHALNSSGISHGNDTISDFHSPFSKNLSSEHFNLHEGLMASMTRARGEDIEARVQNWKPAPMDGYIDEVWWSNVDKNPYFKPAKGKLQSRIVDAAILAQASFYDDAIEYSDWLDD